MLALTDPFVWRGIERLLIVLGAVFFGYLDYRLYILGFTKGDVKVDVKSPVVRFVISGTGPGLLFMVFGGSVLITALCLPASQSERLRSSPDVEEPDVEEPRIIEKNV